MIILIEWHFMFLAYDPGPSKGVQENDKSSAIEQIVSEAVKRVLKENGQLLENFDASKIMELVGQQKLVEKVVEHLAPASSPKKPDVNVSQKSKNHKIYNIPLGTPAYTPTPIAVLKKGVPVQSKVENYEPSSHSSVGRVAQYDPSKVVPKLDDSYTPSSLSSKPSQSKTDSNTYVPTNSSTVSTAVYKPSKAGMKSEEGYTPSTLENTPDVNYTPSSRNSDNVISDRYTPPSSLNCDVDYQPTTRELSSVEPSYSPSCSTQEPHTIDYSPSSISTLTSEPSYSPAPANSVSLDVDYTPSSLSSGQQLTPEKYLALFEAGEDAAASETEAKKKSRSDKEEERRRREKDKERRRRKEKERQREREKRKSGSSRSSDQDSKDSKSKRSSSKHGSSSRSKKSRSSDTKSSPSKSYESKSSKNETEMETDSDVDEECYRIFKVIFITISLVYIHDYKFDWFNTI